ncbi:FCGR3 protein, partial [Ploceus nigricollis]|nr:FCGR3 protein [Ploceus nigricollis]
EDPSDIRCDRIPLSPRRSGAAGAGTVTLRCRGWPDNRVSSVSFCHEGKELGGLHNGAELSLSPLQGTHSSRYSCKGQMEPLGWKESAPVTLTVHSEHPTAATTT